MIRKLILPGGSGFLGTALAQTFSQDDWAVVILSWRAAPPSRSIRTVELDGRTLGQWAKELDGADAVINLAGRSIACLHTPENSWGILDSRVKSVQIIDAAVDRLLDETNTSVTLNTLNKAAKALGKKLKIEWVPS